MENNEALLVDRKTAAQLLGCGRSTLAEWERDGHGPQPVSVGRPGAKRRTLRYSLQALREFASGGQA
jgi:hypothetical protein